MAAFARFSLQLLALAAPCGLLLTHGSPSAALHDLAQLDAVPMHVGGEPPPRKHPACCEQLPALLLEHEAARAGLRPRLRPQRLPPLPNR